MFDITEKLDNTARLMLPGLSSILLFMLVLTPFGLAGLSDFLPDVFLISIYYWSVFRPSVLPFWLIFLLGLCRDVLLGNLLGMSSLIYILFKLIVISKQRYLIKETFWATWVGFGLVAALALIMQWLLVSAFTAEWHPFLPVGMQWAFTCGLYPLLHIVFNALYAFLPPLSSSKQQTPSLI